MGDEGGETERSVLDWTSRDIPSVKEVPVQEDVKLFQVFSTPLSSQADANVLDAFGVSLNELASRVDKIEAADADAARDPPTVIGCRQTRGEFVHKWGKQLGGIEKTVSDVVQDEMSGINSLYQKYLAADLSHQFKPKKEQLHAIVERTRHTQMQNEVLRQHLLDEERERLAKHKALMASQRPTPSSERMTTQFEDHSIRTGAKVGFAVNGLECVPASGAEVENDSN